MEPKKLPKKLPPGNAKGSVLQRWQFYFPVKDETRVHADYTDAAGVGHDVIGIRPNKFPKDDE